MSLSVLSTYYCVFFLKRFFFFFLKLHLAPPGLSCACGVFSFDTWDSVPWENWGPCVRNGRVPATGTTWVEVPRLFLFHTFPYIMCSSQWTSVYPPILASISVRFICISAFISYIGNFLKWSGKKQSSGFIILSLEFLSQVRVLPFPESAMEQNNERFCASFIFSFYSSQRLEIPPTQWEWVFLTLLPLCLVVLLVPAVTSWVVVWVAAGGRVEERPWEIPWFSVVWTEA